MIFTLGAADAITMRQLDDMAKLPEQQAAQAHVDGNVSNAQAGPSAPPPNILRIANESGAERHQYRRQQRPKAVGRQQPAREQGNMQKGGSSKTKANIGRESSRHQALLSFQYGTSYGTRSAPRHKRPVQLTKERLLQATSQLLVSDWTGHEIGTTDPDAVIDWSTVVQVRLYSVSGLTCPVCLEEPKAARITRCGHCFCLSCLLHYLAFAEGNSRRCPLCNEMVHFDDVRSVAVRPSKTVAVKSSMEMSLVAKAKASTMVYPVLLQACCTNQGFVPYAFHAGDSQFGNVLHVTAQDVIDHIINKEKEEIDHHKKFLRAIGDETEIPFLESALLVLEQWKIEIKTAQMSLASALNDNILLSLSQATAASPESMKRNGRETHVHGLPDTNDEVKMVGSGRHQHHSASRLCPEDLFLFYQASDGQHLYLHNFNTRCLAHTYGTLDQCPASISGAVVEIEEMVMTENNKRRFRHLNHLGLGTPFSLVELDLWESLDANTRSQFEGELQVRRQRQREKKRAEEIAAKRAAKKAPHQPFNATDLSQFPLTATSEESMAELEAFLAPVVMATAAAREAMVQTNAAGPSFAQAARSRAQELRPTASPVIGQGSSGPSGWVTLLSSKPGNASTERGHGSESDGDDVPAVPDYRATFANDIARNTPRGGTREGGRGRGNKKDRKGKTVLFTAG